MILIKSGTMREKRCYFYPEINVQVAASANLVRDGHLEPWVSLVKRT